MPAVFEFPTEATVISNDDFAGIDVDIGAGVYDTQKFKAAKLGKRGRLVYVASELGSDSTGLRNRADRPFLTLTAAKAAALAGDTVVVRPGTYDEKDLLKTGVNWWFYPGASVIYTGIFAGAIFDDNAAAVTSQVRGYGVFDNAGSGGVLVVSNAATEINFNGVDLSSNTGFAVNVSAGILNLVSKSLSSVTTNPVNASGGTANIRADSISTNGVSDRAIVISGGTQNIEANSISSGQGTCIAVSGAGTCRIVANMIFGGGGAGLLMLGSGELTVEAFSISSSANSAFVQNSGGTTRITADQLFTLSATAGHSAVDVASGTIFIQAREIDGNTQAAIDVTGSVFRAIVDQIVSTGFAAVSIFSTGSSYLKINSWVGTSALLIDAASAAVVTVDGGALGTGAGGEVGDVTVNSTTATLALLGVRIDGIISLPAAMNNLTIKDCVIVTAGVNSIIGAGACNVRLYGRAMSNKATDGNITFITGAADFEVDTDVIFV